MRLQPIAYASASLKPSEKAYAQIDREGLAVYWVINHFCQYLWGKKFELHTDCSALVKIFGPKNYMGGCAMGRLNRWAAQLMEYDFVIKHIKGSSNCIADSLSRLPVPLDEAGARYPDGVLKELGDLPNICRMELQPLQEEIVMNQVRWMAQKKQHQSECDVTVHQLLGATGVGGPWKMLPLTVADVAKATREDKVYGKLFNAVRSGVLDTKDKELGKFAGVFDNLHIEEEVIYFGSRIVIPSRQQGRMLDELHFSHIGIVKMKDIVRRYFWWPGITKAIENTAAQCKESVKFKRKPAKQPLCPWPFARRPMERVHVDFMEFKGQMILIMVDAYSKKIWASNMGTDTTSLRTLAVLYGWFYEETGFPTTLVSDNGPQLVSKEFEEVVARWGVKHLLSPPYHPQSNGLAERAVGVVKSRLKKMDVSATPIQLHVGLKYICRVHGLSPHSSTTRCPYELIRDGAPPSLFPQLTKGATEMSELTAVRHSADRVRRKTSYAEKKEVIVYDLKTKLSSRGKILEVLGNNNYLVDCGKGSKHISGDVLSKVKLAAPQMDNSDGDQMLTADANNLAQEDIEPASDSSSEDEDGYTEVVPAAVPRRRRRVRAEMLGPTVQHRLRQRR